MKKKTQTPSLHHRTCHRCFRHHHRYTGRRKGEK